MTMPNEELTRRICSALGEADFAPVAELDKLAQKILSGRIKAEDWYALVENSLPRSKAGVVDGN